MKPGFRTLKDIGDLAGRKVLLRVDFNVPLKNGAVDDDFRIVKTLPTLDFLHRAGARTILISHLEVKGEAARPVPPRRDGPGGQVGAAANGTVGGKPVASLLPVQKCLARLGFSAFLAENLESAGAAVSAAPAGSFVLLENIRRFAGEKLNDETFTGSLAALGDVYVNEAFSVSHRAHASIVGVPKFLPSAAGFLFAAEVENLSAVFTPLRPFLFVLGGLKFETKLPLVRKFLDKADHVFVGGALANDFFRAKGFSVGQSAVSEDSLVPAEWLTGKKIILPADAVTLGTSGTAIREPNGIKNNEKIVDVGPVTLAELKRLLKEARMILWNGPLGWCEGGFHEGTEGFAVLVAASRAKSIVGGGDTLAAISRLGLEKKFSFVSTGGGAMLDFLAHETLPGIEALEQGR